MIRRRESPLAVTAGLLALLVHGLFFVLLAVSFSWKNMPPQQIAQVELWDSLPQPHVAAPEPKPEPKPEPPPPKIEPRPEPAPPPEPKAEIQLKAKPPPEAKKPPKVEPKKPDPAQKAKEDEKKRKDEIRKLQQMMLEDQPREHETQQADAKNAAEAKRAAETLAASGGVINDYRGKIQAKIRRFVNRQLCGNGKPELVFAISLMPTGEISGNPRLTRSSGIPACDQAVERAILQAQPLPLPPQPELFTQFRDLELKFRPNDD